MSTPYSIDQDKWARLDIFNQMGNIYSEVGRSFKTLNDIDTKKHDAAVCRTIDLFDATILALSKTKSARAKEVSRSKEEFLTTLMNKDAPQQSIQSLDRYFMQFAVAARLNR